MQIDLSWLILIFLVLCVMTYWLSNQGGGG